MSLNQLRLRMLSLAALCLLTAELSAGVFTATIEAVDAEQRTITVKVKNKDRPQTYEIRASAIITIDGKSAKLDALQFGQTVSVTTNGVDEVTKLTLRTAAKTPPKTAKPEDDGDKPADDAESKTGSKTKPKSTGTKKTPDKKGDKKTEGSASAEAPVGDWPQFRGPNRDNISREPGLLTKWPGDGPELAWKAEGIGLAYSSVAVSRGKVYTMGNRGEEEFLICLDAKSGDELWSLKTGRAYHDGTGDGPRGTPTVDDDRVYALGANGDLVCAGAEKGDQVWQVNILQEFGGKNIVWGISESVLIDGDKVVCTPGGQRATIAALNKHTGKTIWGAQIPGNPQAGYASMIVVEVGKVKQYVNFVQSALVSVKASDGTPLWGEQKSANGTANCSSAIFHEDSVFSASGYGTGGALVRLASAGGQTKSTFAYHTPKMKNHHGGMAAVSGYVYGFDEDVLTCMEIKTGKVKWQDRSVGKGSLTIADGMLYLRSEQGPVALAEVTPDGYNESGRFNQPNRSNNPTWSHPAVANGKLYLRDMDRLLVYNVKGEQ